MSAENETRPTGQLTQALKVGGGASRAELTQKARLFSGILDNLPVAVFCKDASDDFRFLVWNRQNAELTGISREEALGQTDYDVFQKETADFFRQVDKMVMDRGELLDIPEEKVLSPTMGRRFLHTVKLPVVDEEHGIRLLLGICEDITEVKAARAQLERLDKELTEKNELLQKMDSSLEEAGEELKATQLQLIQAEKMESVGRLAAGVAHEVKNPLALMLMGVEYLQSGIDPEDENVPVILTEMREAIERADRIVRGLVDFSSSRQLALKSAPLQSLLEHTLLLVRHELTRGSVEVEKDYDPNLPPARIDQAKMEQVLVNVFMNAVHAMEPEGGGALKVRTRLAVMTEEEHEHDEGARSTGIWHVGDRLLKIEVLDSGHGIPEDKLAKVADPFFTTKPTGVGSGLGLTVVKKIVELHGGTFDIANRKEGGVCVTITLRASDDTTLIRTKDA